MRYDIIANVKGTYIVLSRYSAICSEVVILFM